jgi:DNA helicase-4
LFGNTGNWRLLLTDNNLQIRDGGQQTKIDFANVRIVRVSLVDGWCTVSIVTPAGELQFRGAARFPAAKFRDKLTAAVSAAVAAEASKHAAKQGIDDAEIDRFLKTPRYLARRDIALWLAEKDTGDLSSTSLLQLLVHPLLYATAPSQADPVSRLKALATGASQELADRNARHLASELVAWKGFFDTIESTPLTEQQRRASLVMEDRCLVIAAAGSGKTSTLVAKVGYALSAGHCQPRGVLAIAYNKSAADELRDRLTRRLAGRVNHLDELTAQTFHKVGLDIISAVEGRKPDLAPWANETPDNEGAIINELVAELSASDLGFLVRWNLFRALAAQPNRELPRFASQRDYNDYIAQVGEDRDGHKGIRTLNGELVRSMEELAIANWLFLNGVPYEYEKAYAYDTADQQHRQYHPDFYYPEIDCYHEHFALGSDGKPPSFMAGDYAAGVEWKRALHADRATALIETTSSQYRDQVLFDHLERELKHRGQAFRPRSGADVQAILTELRVPTFTGLVKTFITLAKSNGLTPAGLAELARTQDDAFRARLFLGVATPLFEAYEARLKSLGCIDFEDMIWAAVRYVESGRHVHPYQLILVDEFQDISRCRAKLVAAMLQQNPACKLFAVGDDWQSIYRFSGADQSIMRAFADEFGPTETTFLTQTFRSNQGIVDTASAFIQRNPDQIGKKITAANPRTHSTVHLLEYGKDDELAAILEAEIEALAKNAAQRSAKISILILGRFRHLRPTELERWRRQFAQSADIRFLTLHRSKGLEADYVFILGVNQGAFGLPSTIEDDPLLNMVLPKPEAMEFAEERRLFYVGLTRAKHRCHILTRRGRASPFIKELLGAAGAVYRVGAPRPRPVKAEPCTRCATGVLRELFDDQSKSMRCSNFPRCGGKLLSRLRAAR